MKNKKNSFLALFLIIITCFAPALTIFAEKKPIDEDNYKQYSNQKVSFGLGLHTDHTVPSGNRPEGVKLKDYNAYYYDIKAKKKEPVVYLTFDCGYENGYTKKILNVLKQKKVKAIFFVTETYIKSAPKLVKRMKKEGHLVGNHTCSHPQLTNCSVSKIKKELNQCAKTMKKLTGYEMDKYIRPPEGVYSVRVLKILQDMGYATFLWSLAYYDYDTDKQPGKDYVINKFKTHYFNGMIPLIHAISKSNTEALPEIIDFLAEKEYRFATIDEIA